MVANKFHNPRVGQVSYYSHKKVDYRFPKAIRKIIFLDHIFSFVGMGDSRNVLQKISNISDMDRP